VCCLGGAAAAGSRCPPAARGAQLSRRGWVPSTVCGGAGGSHTGLPTGGAGGGRESWRAADGSPTPNLGAPRRHRDPEPERRRHCLRAEREWGGSGYLQRSALWAVACAGVP
jgi:hypothetical protein